MERNIYKIGKELFITSDEEIKEGVDQWYLDKYLNKLRNSSGAQYGEKQNVIILTTDQDLIKDGVQAIGDEFLEWFVNNPSCEFVKIGLHQEPLGEVFNGKNTNTMWTDPKYKIIIPKEEPKQETRKNRLLEELVEDIKNQQSFLKSIRKNPQLYYYKFGTCIYERLYNNNNCFEMQDPYGGQSSKMEQELINLKAEKIYYE